MAASTARSARLEGAIAEVPIPIALFNARSRRLVRSSAGFRRALDADVTNYDQLFDPDDRATALREFEAVASGRVDGLHLSRTLFDGNGGVQTQVWLRRIREDQATFVALAFLLHDDLERQVDQELIVDAATDGGLIVTDHEWNLEFVSQNIESVFEETPETARGKSLLSLVHPATAADFTLAVSRAIATGRGALIYCQLRAGTGWRRVVAWIEPLCEDSPPRLGLMILKLGEPRPKAGKSTSRLEQHLWRIGAEILAAGILPTLDDEHLAHAPALARLTPQQWEITVRLVNGERVPQIARSMHLSQSTVRNHLAAVFRRFGVHSQSELIATLNRRSPPSAGT